jgi:hypothetical protein
VTGTCYTGRIQPLTCRLWEGNRRFSGDVEIPSNWKTEFTVTAGGTERVTLNSGAVSYVPSAGGAQTLGD